MVFVDRRKKGPDPYLRWKVAAFSLGAVLALVGMAREARWLVTVAVAVLAVGFLLRFLPQEGDGGGAGWEDG